MSKVLYPILGMTYWLLATILTMIVYYHLGEGKAYDFNELLDGWTLFF